MASGYRMGGLGADTTKIVFAGAVPKRGLFRLSSKLRSNSVQ